MTTKEIADRLVAYCRKGDFSGAQEELFAPDAVSIEPYASGGFAKETKGTDAIREKGELWNSMVEEMQGLSVSDPIVAGHSFACTMNMKVTIKEKGFMDMTELCLYKVKDGKIISEEFAM